MLNRTTMVALSCLCVAAMASAQSAARLSRPIEFHNPDWSPDGRTLVFESTLGGKYSIYSIGADGGGLTRLTADTANNSQPRWSPDGRRIVFSSDRAGHLDLCLMNADGSGQVRLTTMSGGGYYQSSFSPDGKWVLFQGRPDNRETRDRVYLVASDGTGLRQLTDSSYGAEEPRWSPDGKTIQFLQVPYPKRFRNEMQPEDMNAARAGERFVTIRPDGSGLAPLANARKGDSGPTWLRNGTRAFFRSARDGVAAVYEMGPGGSGVRRVADAAVVASPNPSPDGRRFAYTKSVDGWAGLYVYDIAARTERLVIGGPGAGPLGYLRAASLIAITDTLDTFASAEGSREIKRGNGAWVVRSLGRIGARRYDLTDTWYDSAGTVTTRQYARTARGSLATDLETVRALGDSASMSVTQDRVTAWVVPQGQAPRLFDGATTGERFSGIIVAAAIGRSRPAVGAVFVAPSASLYGGNPIETRVDTIRVVRRDTLFSGTTPVAALVLARGSGTELWVDETTGAALLSRGNAGPERWWWHIRRGLRMARPPE